MIARVKAWLTMLDNFEWVMLVVTVAFLVSMLFWGDSMCTVRIRVSSTEN